MESSIEKTDPKEDENEEDQAPNDEDQESVYSEEIEPKLKYARITNDLQNIFFQDSASCIAVHPKFICIGTHFGMIHLLDHQGNSIRYKELRAHTVAVNQISIDINGDYIASCSDDGKVYVYGLYTSDNNQEMVVGRLVKCIAIDPSYYKSGSGRRFITGDERLVLHEKTLFSRIKSTVLSEAAGEGGVQTLRWSSGGQWVAWASQIGVRVYDMNARCSLGLIKWNKSAIFSYSSIYYRMQQEKPRCNICWKDTNTFLIGWVETIRICNIRKRSQAEMALTPNWPQYTVEPAITFQTDFLICGIAPLEEELVVLGYCKEQDGPQRPQLHVIEPKVEDYVDNCTNSLNLRGYHEYSCLDYHLECLREENRYVVVSPKDIVVASPFDADDKISWMIEHEKFDLAMEAVTSTRLLKNHSLLTVGQAYLEHLFRTGEYEEAGKLCPQILGKDKRLWEEEVFKFATRQELRAVSPYLPKDLAFSLDPHIYEMVLYEFLKMDPKGFLNMVKEWPPRLYNVRAVVNATLEHILITKEDEIKPVLLEAVAILYSNVGQYDKALAMYLKLKHSGVFELIHKHKLYSEIHNMIEGLMSLDAEKAIALFLEKECVPTDVVVRNLKDNKYFLFLYLDALEKRDVKMSGRKYHGTLVQLYSDFDRNKLLPLLHRSDFYPIEDALKICKEKEYFPEMVYLLGRIGSTKEALALIIEKVGNIEQAINFCKEHDDAELWEDLINYSLKKPDYINFLLQRIGTYIDPRILVEKIECNLEIPGLKKSLVKMMQDYNLQVSVQEGCKKILVSDYFSLFERLVSMQKRGAFVDDEQFCGACHRRIIVKDLSQANNILMFYCHHSFHEQCLPATQLIESCIICRSQKSDRSNLI
uniref:RING-type domain-containing protein n=1 Tax=Clastoptera arizonana TaxID=38151 RepID=A0A1B6C2S4_9HEMI